MNHYPPLSEHLTRLEKRGLDRTAYSTLEVADMLGVSKEHIHRMVRAGLIPHKRLGRRIIVPRVLFEQWLSTSDAWASADASPFARWRGN